MGKTIKVIDFLIKKANKEDLPKKVKFHNEIFVASDECCGEHINQEEDFDGSRRCLFEGWVLGKILNDEVEIIEEDKEIEEINKSYPIFKFDEKSFEAMKDMLQDVYSKQVEIIKAVNELKKGKE